MCTTPSHSGAAVRRSDDRIWEELRWSLTRRVRDSVRIVFTLEPGALSWRGRSGAITSSPARRAQAPPDLTTNELFGKNGGLVRLHLSGRLVSATEAWVEQVCRSDVAQCGH